MSRLDWDRRCEEEVLEQMFKEVLIKLKAGKGITSNFTKNKPNLKPNKQLAMQR